MAEWPWRYRSRSKVIAYDTPSHCNNHVGKYGKTSLMDVKGCPVYSFINITVFILLCAIKIIKVYHFLPGHLMCPTFLAIFMFYKILQWCALYSMVLLHSWVAAYNANMSKQMGIHVSWHLAICYLSSTGFGWPQGWYTYIHWDCGSCQRTHGLNFVWRWH